MHKLVFFITAIALISASAFIPAQNWESSFVKLGKNGKLIYTSDAQGNVIPDFSRVGFYKGDKPIPNIPVVSTVEPSSNSLQTIQSAIDALAAKPIGSNGFRGVILLKKGIYEIPSSINIKASGIILRGEGEATKLIATGNTQYTLISVNGNGSPKELPGRIKISDAYVPAGATSFNIESTGGFKTGDKIIVHRPATENWIHDIKMDQIETREGTKQWTTAEYALQFERVITNIKGKRIYIDNPIVMAMDAKYGGGEVYPYSFEGRITHVGIENLSCESTYSSDTAEDHAWDAIRFNRIENGWIRNVTSRYFGYSCINLGQYAKFITVMDSRCYDAKSKIEGSRRYSFNNDGQMNLFMNCETTDGRHDYVTGAKVAGPNVFYNCKASRTHADIGPHHRWSAGTLYDNIVTDGEINVQDRGNWGTGHGWSGVTQVIWNCTAKRAAIQSPWASGKNYCIGLQGEKYEGRLKGRPDAEWEGRNRDGLNPKSLYLAQLDARR